MNTIMLLGNLGRDLEGSSTTSGTAVTTCTLAVSRKVKGSSSSEKQEDVDVYHN